jgi:hypothetical protein
MLGVVIPSLPFLGYRFLREYLRFKSSAHNAGKIFYDELVDQGIDPGYAEDLTDSYLESRNLLRIMTETPSRKPF